MKNFLFFLLFAAALTVALMPAETQCCTSWMIFSDFTGNNTNILHKNRDASPRNIRVFMSPADSPRKWISLSDRVGGVNSGINTSGLAGIMNSGELCSEPTANKSKKRTPEMMRTILESCDTAKQAVAKLQELLAAGDYWHGKRGSIFFFCDPKEGFICEVTAKHCSVQRYSRGFAVRANIWQNPNMYELSRNTITGYLNSSARAYIAISLLNEAMDKNQKISVDDVVAASRHCRMPEKSPLKRPLCGKDTNSGATIEIDRQYPGILSAMYVSIGAPRNTVCIPVPVCVEKIHPAIADLRWADAAWKRYEKLGFDAEIPAEWLAFEKAGRDKFKQVQEQARKLLDNGNRDEAVKLLNAAACEIWNDAAALMKL